jgi:hypothetical protein
MNLLPLRGLIAPVFIALAIAAGFLTFRINSESLRWLSLVFLALWLVFARDTRRLFDNAMRAVRGNSLGE